MKKIAPKPGLVIAAMIYVVILAFMHLLCLIIGSFWFDLQYLIFAIIGSVFNLAVAHHNYTGRYNVFTRFVEKLSGRFYSGR